MTKGRGAAPSLQFESHPVLNGKHHPLAWSQGLFALRRFKLGGGSGYPGLLLVGGGVLGLLGGDAGTPGWQLDVVSVACSNMELLSSTQRNGAVASVLGP